jgi:hypothetical protein
MFIIEEYIDKLIINLPPPPIIPTQIDLVMDGGSFNGSYLIGCLYFLKRMEKLKYIVIHRISGCSISSFLGLLYLIDSLNNVESTNFYQNVNSIDKFLPETVDVSLLSKRLYITYNNIRDMKEVVANKFRNKLHVCECIIRSSFIPCLINGELLHKNKYIAGIIPFLFQPKKNRKILYLNIINYEMINVTNTNYGRLLSGLLDIHMFYIKKSSTDLCSYVNNWNLINKSTYFIKKCFAKYIIFFIKTLYYFFPESRISKIIIQELLHTFLSYIYDFQKFTLS